MKKFGPTFILAMRKKVGLVLRLSYPSFLVELMSRFFRFGTQRHIHILMGSKVSEHHL